MSIPEASNGLSKREKLNICEKSKETSEKISTFPVAYGTRSKKKIDWARRRGKCFKILGKTYRNGEGQIDGSNPMTFLQFCTL